MVFLVLAWSATTVLRVYSYAQRDAALTDARALQLAGYWTKIIEVDLDDAFAPEPAPAPAPAPAG